MKLESVVSPSFQRSLSKLGSQHLPMKTMYSLRQIILRAREEKRLFEEIRAEKLVFYSEKNERGEPLCEDKTDQNGQAYQMYQITDKNRDLLNKDIKDLLQVEVDLPYVMLEDLGDCPDLTAEDLVNLEFVVDRVPERKLQPKKR